MGFVDRIRLLFEQRKHKKYDFAKEFDKRGYQLVRCVNRGRFGLVHLATTGDGRRLVAIKTVEEHNCMVGERHLWSRLGSAHCVRLLECFSAKGYVHFVCEYAACGDVMSWLESVGKPLGPHLEDFARELACQVLLAFHHCHLQNLAHLDFKWANVLLDDAMTAKLTGFSYMCSKSDAQGICLGDPLYHPPEALTTGVSRNLMDKVDLWQLGVSLIHMLLGWYIPVVLHTSSDRKISDVALVVDVQNEQVYLPRKLAGFDDDLQDFLKLLLKYHPEDRPTAAEALHHPWIAVWPPWDPNDE